MDTGGMNRVIGSAYEGNIQILGVNTGALIDSGAMNSSVT